VGESFDQGPAVIDSGFGTSQTFTVIQNWFEELKARVPTGNSRVGG
jgi:hypothetical protein